MFKIVSNIFYNTFKLQFLLGVILTFNLSTINFAYGKDDWETFLKNIKNIKKSDLIKSNENNINTKKAFIELKNTILYTPNAIDSGVKVAIEDLKNFLYKTTGHLPLEINSIDKIPKNIDDLTTIILFNPEKLPYNLKVKLPIKSESYLIHSEKIVKGTKSLNTITLYANDLNGKEYSIYRLMEILGKRFFYYNDDYFPEKALIPSDNFEIVYSPKENFKLRGFSPHFYHPIPLSIAFHEPSEKHFQMLKKYLDWLVYTHQNYVIFPMLELDKQNRLLPIKDDSKKKFKEWVPFAKRIVEYAHERGVQVSIKIAFANYVSSNSYAINPFKALYQSVILDNLEKKISEEKLKLSQNPKLSQDNLNLLENNYKENLAKFSKEDFQEIKTTIDDFMQISWDEMAWQIGTSEFSPTNDDLAIGWMNSTAEYLKKTYPKVRMTVRSHVPKHPFSTKYNVPFFHLMKFTSTDVGALVHTVQPYSINDYAPVYGNENFLHQLKLLYELEAERINIFYPESSYWVTYDVDIPFFLPVYILNRAHDVNIVKQLENLKGHAIFTTGWEWGYWLNDYISAKLQANPDLNLVEELNTAFEVFGKNNKNLVKILLKTMEIEQEYLLDKNLHRYIKGSSPLTDFGVDLQKNPLFSSFLQGTNSTPIRVKPKEVMEWDLEKVTKFENGDLKDIEILNTSFNDFYSQFRSFEDSIPKNSLHFYKELLDCYHISYLRSKQIYSSFKALVLLRKGILLNEKKYKSESLMLLKRVERIYNEALKVIREREKNYRDASEYTTDIANGPTLWNDRYLTPVHTAIYWKTTFLELNDVFKKINFE